MLHFISFHLSYHPNLFICFGKHSENRTKHLRGPNPALRPLLYLKLISPQDNSVKEETPALSSIKLTNCDVQYASSPLPGRCTCTPTWRARFPRRVLDFSALAGGGGGMQAPGLSHPQTQPPLPDPGSVLPHKEPPAQYSNILTHGLCSSSADHHPSASLGLGVGGYTPVIRSSSGDEPQEESAPALERLGVICQEF